MCSTVYEAVDVVRPLGKTNRRPFARSDLSEGVGFPDRLRPSNSTADGEDAEGRPIGHLPRLLVPE